MHRNSPSVISTVNQQNTTKIFIGDKAKINGIILLNSLGKTRDNESIIEMGEDSHVIGQVYSSAFFSYHNNIKIEGTLFCNTIRFLSEHTVRDNNISGIEINHSKLPKAFVGLNFFDHDKKEAIIYEFYYETLIKESKGYH